VTCEDLSRVHAISPRLVPDNGRRQVDADRMAGDLGQPADDQAGAANHVQHIVLRADLGNVDEVPVGLVVRVGRHL
jgi:hypothetical protein